MEHYRSTLATTAFAVIGLVVAARVLHPANFEAQPRSGLVVDVSAEATNAPTTWIHPPLTLRGPEPAGMMQDSAAVLAPSLTVALPDGAMTVPRLSSALVAPPVVEKATADPLDDLIRKLDRDEG